MKTIRTVFIFITLTATFSCSYLDFDETNGLQGKEDVYKYFDKTKQVLTNVYSYIPQDFGALAVSGASPERKTTACWMT